MLESTQPIDKREFEECVDATVLARNVLLRTHGFSQDAADEFGFGWG